MLFFYQATSRKLLAQIELFKQSHWQQRKYLTPDQPILGLRQYARPLRKADHLKGISSLEALSNPIRNYLLSIFGDRSGDNSSALASIRKSLGPVLRHPFIQAHNHMPTIHGLGLKQNP